MCCFRRVGTSPNLNHQKSIAILPKWRLGKHGRVAKNQFDINQIAGNLLFYRRLHMDAATTLKAHQKVQTDAKRDK